ncbi:MAG TPA: glycosyltransferase family 1 protein [Steroidobacteraceae bacterium]|nr:glycosyltransferase family 1 protein [Steroidobacteraceae bacterium]
MHQPERVATHTIDCRWIGRHGIGRFAAELHARLPGFAALALRGRPSSPLDPWMLRRHLQRTRTTFFFSPGYNAPARSPCAFAFCVHDLNHLHVRENSSALKRAYYEQLIRPAMHAAAVVFTVSAFSRAALCDWSGVSEESVVNVGNGASAAFTPTGSVADFGRPYFLYVGNHKPHKNILGLLRAFAASGLQREFLLVATGRPEPALRQAIALLALADAVRFVGSVTDEQLAALYRGATALALLSTHEGFGLPVLEAMSCGTPVLCSTSTALPEIAGGAALLVEAARIDDVSTAMRELARNEELRRSLRLRGRERARAFSWDRTAHEVQRALAARGLLRPVDSPSSPRESRACASR